MRRIAMLVAVSTSLPAPAAGQPPSQPASSPPLLPIADECRLTLGTGLASSLGPLKVTLSLDRRGSGIRVERDGMAGAGEGAGEARLTTSRSSIFPFSHQLGAGRYVFSASSDGTALLELLAGSPKLTIGPLTSHEDQVYGQVPLFQGAAPHLSVDLGAVTPQVTELIQCAQMLAIADKAMFCAHVTAFQANQGCPVSTWRMTGRDDQQIDWVDTNRLKRNGSTIQMVILTQHGRAVAVPQPADRMAAIRIVSGDCATRSY